MNKIQQCARLLADPDACKEAMEMAVDKYPISAEQHLSKQGNRNPWMGQSACCVWFGATEEETRIAWNFYMTKEEQDSANNIAKLVIASWEAKNA